LGGGPSYEHWSKSSGPIDLSDVEGHAADTEVQSTGADSMLVSIMEARDEAEYVSASIN
jgi:hypothetical protein